MSDERKFVVNITTRQIHSTASQAAECQPQPTDVLGWGDSLEALTKQGFSAHGCASEGAGDVEEDDDAEPG